MPPTVNRFAANVSMTAGLTLVVAVLSLRFSEVAFLGWDAYPILAAAGPGSAGETGWLLPADVFARPLADGLLPMSFYRPLLSLTVALEWPLWGLTAGGYAAVNAALLGLCGATLHSLLLNLGATRRMALFAVGFFILHPVVPDVVPYLPRRPELLCTLFVLLALQLDHRGRHRRSRAWIAAAALATAAAVGSKETAIALPILIAAARWLFPAPHRGTALRQAIRGFATQGAVVAVVFLLRAQVLGGLGGYADTDVTQLPGLWLRTLAKTLLGVLPPDGALPSISLAMLMVGTLAMAVRQTRNDSTSRRAALLAWFGPQRLRLAGLASIWILTFATVYAAAARLSSWYLLIVACGAAIGFGLAMDLALSAIRDRATEPATVAALLGGALILASFAVASPLFRPLEEFRQASRDAEAFLEKLEVSIRQTPGGQRIKAGPYPRLTISADDRQVPVLVPRALPGWARIVFPDRRIAFVAPGESFAEPIPPDVTVVVLGGGIHRDLDPDC